MDIKYFLKLLLRERKIEKSDDRIRKRSKDIWTLNSIQSAIHKNVFKIFTQCSYISKHVYSSKVHSWRFDLKDGGEYDFVNSVYLENNMGILQTSS